MSKSDQRNIILRLVLLGIFFWIGLSSASSPRIGKSIDYQKAAYLDHGISQKCTAGYSSYDLGSNPGLWQKPAAFQEIAISPSKLRYDEMVVNLRLFHCHKIYLAIKGAWLQIHHPGLIPIRFNPTFPNPFS